MTGADWVRSALASMPMPEAPSARPWDCSAAALIAPRLPVGVRRVAGSLDRFGAVRLSPWQIGIDTMRAVPWQDVLEVQTRPLLDVIATTIGEQAARFAPPMPGVRYAANKVLPYVANTIASTLLVSLLDRRDGAAGAQVPYAITVRGKRKPETTTAGPVSAAILCLPQVSACLVTTAGCYGIPIVGAQATLPPGSVHRFAETLRDRAVQGGTDDHTGVPAQAPGHRRGGPAFRSRPGLHG